MSKKFNDILSVLDTINKENVVSVYVPSLEKEVNFKGITTGQQKSFLKSAVDNPVFQTRFILAAYALIKENCLEPDVFKVLTANDAAAILVQLRIHVYGTDYTVTADNQREYKVSLTDVVDNIKNIKINLTTTLIEEGPFTIRVGLPSFNDQYLLEKQLREKGLSNEQGFNAGINETIGEAFVGEVSKYIKSIQIKLNSQAIDVEYDSLTFINKHEVLEKLPSTVVKGIVKYIEELTNLQKKVFTVYGSTASGAWRVHVPVDTALFAIE